MSISDLKKIDIYSKEEEEHVQVLMNIQMEHNPSLIIAPLVFPHAVTDGIKTLEQEKILQKEMDEYSEMMKRNIMGEDDEDVEAEESNTEMGDESSSDDVQEEVNVTIHRFCDFCDSKGVRHKKVCTREAVAA